MRSCLVALLLSASLAAHAETTEEARLSKAQAAMPEAADAFSDLTRAFARDWSAAPDARESMTLARQYGRQLWQQAKSRIRARDDYDDRPLYWARLALTRTVRDAKPAFPLFAADRAAALDALEQASRGLDDVAYPAGHDTLRVLVTGFDPFLLDRHLDQSNPSGVCALLLDGAEFDVHDPQGRLRHVHVEAGMMPVRMADFDQGIVERFLQPWLTAAHAPRDWLDAARAKAAGESLPPAKPRVDMVVTISMGRTGFDLERFPGLRRSARAPDNEGVFSGGTLDAPVLPSLNGHKLDGAEFVEFSLPAQAMLAVQQPYPVQDNRWVRVAPNTRMAVGGLPALAHKTAVEGGGGGYYSNEISYRALRLRDALGLGSLPMGHIHTPALAGRDTRALRDIAAELQALLSKAAAVVPIVHQAEGQAP